MTQPGADGSTRLRKKAEEYLAKCSEYTSDYERDKILDNWEKRSFTAAQVVDDFKKRAGPVAGKRILDLGFGSGVFSISFANAGALVSGLEVNEVLADIAKENVREAGTQADLRIYDGAHFPFADDTFDGAVAVSVLEHVSDQQQFLKEASRVLKQGGAFYLAFPSRLRPRETHCGVLFISYLPRPLGQFLLRTIWKSNAIEELNLHFIGYWGLKRMLKQTQLIIRPEWQNSRGPKRALKRMLWALGMHHSALLGTVMVILEKK